MNDLNRFIEAQEKVYEKALEEIKNGHKRSHWIWYIFPQIQGLGFSSTSKFYAIADTTEARAYIENDLLRERLIEISESLLKLDTHNATEVMGTPDDLKLHSSMTLFKIVAPEYDVFEKVLDKFFDGKLDPLTLEMLNFEERRSK